MPSGTTSSEADRHDTSQCNPPFHTLTPHVTHHVLDELEWRMFRAFIG